MLAIAFAVMGGVLSSGGVNLATWQFWVVMLLASFVAIYRGEQ